ncbi:MAG: hypothetical protein Kow0069_15040 [Promethearchaeota archaeon]
MSAGDFFELPTDVAPYGGDQRDATVVVDAGGVLHAFFERAAPGGVEVVYANKTSPTAPWSDTFNVSRLPGDDVNPTCVLDASGVLHVVWENSLDGALVYANYSTLAGFSSPVEFFNLTGVAEARPVLAKGPDAATALHLAFEDDPWGNHDVYYLNRTLLGWWSGPPANASNTPAPSHHPSAAVNGSGVVSVAWIEDDGAGGDAWFATGGGAGGGFGAATPVTSDDEPDAAPSLAVNSTGGFSLAWQATRGGVNLVSFANSSDGINFASCNVTTGTSPVVVLNGSGAVHLLWRDIDAASDFEVFHALKPDAGAWFGEVHNVSRNLLPDAEPAAAVDPLLGVLYVVWTVEDSPARLAHAVQAVRPPAVEDLQPSGAPYANVTSKVVNLNATIRLFHPTPREFGAWVTINTTETTSLNLTRVASTDTYRAYWVGAFLAPNGFYEARFHAWDGFHLNDTESVVFYKWTFDEEPPLVLDVAPANGSVVGYHPVEFNATVLDASAVVEVNFTVNATPAFTVGAAYDPVASSWRAWWTNGTSYPNGWYEARVAARDVRGFVNDTERVAFYKDSDFSAPLVLDPRPGMGANVTWSPFQVNVTVVDDRVVDEVRVSVNASESGQAWVDLSPAGGNLWTGTWDDALDHPQAWYNFTVHARDGWDNVNDSVWFVAFRGPVKTDVTPPAIVGPHPGDGNAVACLPVTFNASVADAGGVQWVNVVLNASAGPVVVPLRRVEGAGTLWEGSLAELAPGTYSAEFRAVDYAYNERVVTVTFALLGATCATGGGDGGADGNGSGGGENDGGTGGGSGNAGGGEWYGPGPTVPGYSAGWIAAVAVASSSALVAARTRRLYCLGRR